MDENLLWYYISFVSHFYKNLLRKQVTAENVEND